MPRGNTWYNEDGLSVGFGTHTADSDTGVTTATSGSTAELVIDIPDLTALDTAANAVLAATGGIYAAGYHAGAATIPANATVQQVTIKTTTAATSGGAADLTLGAYTVDDDTGLLVAVDADGFAAAGDSALADFSVAGETIVLGKAAGAALVGKATVGAAAVVVAPTYATAAYTAGALQVIIEYTHA